MQAAAAVTLVEALGAEYKVLVVGNQLSKECFNEKIFFALITSGMGNEYGMMQAIFLVYYRAINTKNTADLPTTRHEVVRAEFIQRICLLGSKGLNTINAATTHATTFIPLPSFLLNTFTRQFSFVAIQCRHNPSVYVQILNVCDVDARNDDA